MGDAAIQRVIDVCQDLNPWLEGQPSVRIEHASLLFDSMLKELKGAKIGLAVSTQPIFFFAEEDSYRQFLSADQLKMAYRIKSLDKENLSSASFQTLHAPRGRNRTVLFTESTQQ